VRHAAVGIDEKGGCVGELSASKPALLARPHSLAHAEREAFAGSLFLFLLRYRGRRDVKGSIKKKQPPVTLAEVAATAIGA